MTPRTARLVAGVLLAVWPLVPRPPVAEGFDPPDSPWGSGHRGVDLRGHVGQPVRASEAGTITFAAVIAGRGVVVVDHGAVRTTYEPVDAGVGVGQHVGEGARIGTLALAGSHCPPRACLHWGLVRGRTYLDPLTLVGAGPVRLLPLDTPLSVTSPRSPRSPRSPGSAGASGSTTARLSTPGLLTLSIRLVGVPVYRPHGVARW